VSRRIAAGDRHVRSGGWLKGNMDLARSLTGKTMGIFGLGRIGGAIARRAEALRMHVVYGVRARKPDAAWPYFDDLRAMAKACDVLVVTVPGGASTRHSVNGDIIEALGPTGILVNVSRGSVVDEVALVAALAADRLGGAGLDVFEDEPRVPSPLFGMDHVVLQPHVGSATQETRRKMAELMVENLLRHFAGKPLLTPVA
jgi:lactate dehydrogenase-like 2-hydroxyacid dehydrogenase